MLDLLEDPLTDHGYSFQRYDGAVLRAAVRACVVWLCSCHPCC